MTKIIVTKILKLFMKFLIKFLQIVFIYFEVTLIEKFTKKDSLINSLSKIFILNEYIKRNIIYNEQLNKYYINIIKKNIGLFDNLNDKIYNIINQD